MIAIGRAAVINLSESDSIHGVEVSLTHHRRKHDGLITSIDRNLINNATNQQYTSLHARREGNFNLFIIRQGPGWRDELFIGPFVDGERILLKPGKYILKVTASSENMKRENARFSLEFDDGCRSVKYRLLGDTTEADAVGWNPTQDEHSGNLSPPDTPQRTRP